MAAVLRGRVRRLLDTIVKQQSQCTKIVTCVYCILLVDDSCTVCCPLLPTVSILVDQHSREAMQAMVHGLTLFNTAELSCSKRAQEMELHGSLLSKLNCFSTTSLLQTLLVI